MIKIDNINHFNNTFLSLVSKVCDNACIKVDNKQIYSVTNSSDNTIVIFSTYKQDNEYKSLNLNVPDVNRLMRILSCVTDNDIKLDVDTNCIKYNSPDVRFKYHLLEDGIISVPAVSIDKIKQLDFKYSFNVDRESIMSLIKGSSLVADVDKLYFYHEEECVYAEITDKETSNTDSYTQKIADKWKSKGDDDKGFDQMSISFEILRIISGLRFDTIKIRINTDVNVLLFEVVIDNVKHNFICTTYIR
ncbi:MAG: hypothetical protein CMM25_01935 [Rhodospirillaceae bacterium]|nr:hypothetical protein [Rhodospirillaceae bacterium]